MSIFSKSDPIFQDLNIFVKAIKPKTYVIEKVRLQGPINHDIIKIIIFLMT